MSTRRSPRSTAESCALRRSVTANGTAELTNFDIYAAAVATNKAVQRSFTVTAGHSLPLVLTDQPQDTYFGLAVPIDFNGDGRQDLLMPVPAGTLPNQGEALPAWAVLQATGATDGPTFTLVDPRLPFDAALSEQGVSLADPHGARTGDVNGDGAEDIVLVASQ